MLPQDGSGFVDWREFLCGIALSKKQSTDDAWECKCLEMESPKPTPSQAAAAVCFKVFDADGDGGITPAELCQVSSRCR